MPLALIEYDGTGLADDIKTKDLQVLHPSADGFIVNGLGGDDIIKSSFIGRSGNDFVDGGDGNDLMTVYGSYMSPKRITNTVLIFGGYGTDESTSPCMKVIL